MTTQSYKTKLITWVGGISITFILAFTLSLGSYKRMVDEDHASYEKLAPQISDLASDLRNLGTENRMLHEAQGRDLTEIKLMLKKHMDREDEHSTIGKN